MYDPLCTMITNIVCLTKSHNSLDKIHLLQKEWLDTVVNKVHCKYATSILNNLFEMLEDLFDYIGAHNEMNLYLK